MDALNSRAPLWLRIKKNALETVTAEFDQLGWRWQSSDVLPTALQVLDEVDVTSSRSFESGRVEVQDLGSQLLLESAGVAPATRWLDACAGAGGKTLQLAELLGDKGQVDAFDVRRAALAELELRARRAGSKSIKILPAVPTQDYDGVLVDAPCTGSGTWRRAPHLKWTTTIPQITDAALMQRTLLEQFSERVRLGGQLLYATCSLNHSENEHVVTHFLNTHRDFALEPPYNTFGGHVSTAGLAFLPALHNTDGFFIARLRRK